MWPRKRKVGKWKWFSQKLATSSAVQFPKTILCYYLQVEIAEPGTISVALSNPVDTYKANWLHSPLSLIWYHQINRALASAVDVEALPECIADCCSAICIQPRAGLASCRPLSLPGSSASPRTGNFCSSKPSPLSLYLSLSLSLSLSSLSLYFSVSL